MRVGAASMTQINKHRRNGAMAKDRAAEHAEYYHNKGEKDRAEGKGYHPPSTNWFIDVDQELADLESYGKGWTNADNQTNKK